MRTLSKKLKFISKIESIFFMSALWMLLSLILLVCFPSSIAVMVLWAGTELSVYEGFGAKTAGAASSPTGFTNYHVTSLKDNGPGTLRDAVSRGKRRVVFDIAGTIALKKDIALSYPYLTIDGSTAPAPGITIKKTTISDGEFIIAGTHDIIVKHLRFHGLFKRGGPNRNCAATITIDGDTKPDYIAQRIILDHITARNATDGGPDIWGEVRDVTISWCFFFYNWHPTLISHYPGGPFQIQRISMHHNVYAKNGERNPQIHGDVRDLDYVNNVIYDWGYYSRGNFGYGIRLKNRQGEPKVNANFVNNYFLLSSKPPHTRYSWALVYGMSPGPDSDDGGPSGNPPTQGTVVTTSKMGNLWVTGNILPNENEDHYSTINSPIPIPSVAHVTTFPASQLKTEMMHNVGTHFPTSEEQALINEIITNMNDFGVN